jgi:hypothetical protein
VFTQQVCRFLFRPTPASESVLVDNTTRYSIMCVLCVTYSVYCLGRGLEYIKMNLGSRIESSINWLYRIKTCILRSAPL